ncbi:MAG: exopolyphosphatase/guanosine-5'-triphosphate,3'-diphosphate pyrophosphatase [Flavobacteriales bacterium]|jgi:exopolyphosphatase/guanosine-5'-triphosphate,3'-diphosphate pyrophosphatase
MTARTGALNSACADMRVATVDVGSNTALLLVAERDGAGWRAVYEEATVCRVSEGLDASGELQAAPLARTRDVLEHYGRKARELGVSHVMAVGTAPFRRATNGAWAASQLSAALGTPIDVISGEREGELSLIATRDAFPGLGEMLVVDIGGASTEIIATDAEGGFEMVSLDIGAVRLTERCVTEHPLGDASRGRLRGEIAEALDAASVRALTRATKRPLVGVAGTVTTLCTASLELDVYDATRVHGHSLSLTEVRRLYEALALLSVNQRSALPGVEPKRADVLPTGALLLMRVMEACGVDSLTVSNHGVRWGLLSTVSG